MATSDFGADDRAQLEARGIDPAEAERQLHLLREPPPPVVLARPCTLGDGIEAIAPARRAELASRARDAAAAGRGHRFVPASGAATRMFRELLAHRADGSLGRAELEQAADDNPAAAAVLAIVRDGARLACAEGLARLLARSDRRLDALHSADDVEALLAALLDADGLGYADLPKGLLAFHRGPDGPLTAFAEQVREAAAIRAAETDTTRLHLTVSPEHRPGFAAELERIRRRHRGPLEVAFSVQDPATDTIALDDRGRPARDSSGQLLLRPAGHGALIGNLGSAGFDLVFVKNIDNLVPARLAGPTHDWTLTLLGLAAELRAELDDQLRALSASPTATALAGATAFARQRLGLAPPDGGDPAALRTLLDRPVRVAGMVPNTGDTGGGPFWVRDRSGQLSRQVVESAQVDDQPAQRAILAAATHFNPVFLACALRDAGGSPYDLTRYVDPDAIILANKSHQGREIVALERPGLWNGAMAGWHTVFVEVPIDVFHPVKSITDLLRPEHQA